MHRQDHHHQAAAAAESSSRRLWMAFAITVLFMGVEVAAGFLFGSLALLSDAGHMFTDAGSLAIALFAQAIAGRERTGKQTFGYRRAEILAAFVNGMVLAASAVWVLVEAFRRIHSPAPVMGFPLLIVATVGLLVNLVVAAILAGGRSNLNIRAAFTHVLSDAAGSVAAMIAGFLVWLRGWHAADPMVSILISLLVLWSAWKLVQSAVHVLMEGTPQGVDSKKLGQTILATPGVASFHDLHVWTISSGFPLVTVHVVLSPNFHGTDVADHVSRRIQAATGITHVTVQPEAPGAPLVGADQLRWKGK